MAEKFESLTLEYSYLLSQQLESQRDYFEKKLMFAEEDAMDRIVSVETEVCSPSALIIVSIETEVCSPSALIIAVSGKSVYAAKIDKRLSRYW